MKNMVGKADRTATSADYKTLGFLQERTHVRKGIVGCGEGFTVALNADGTVLYAGENRWGQAAAASWRDMSAICCGPDYIIGICSDGTVRAAGRNTDRQLAVESWACVRTVSCGLRHAAGVTSNGCVVCTGEDMPCTCTDHWRDMVDVCCGDDFTIGLRRDGTVIAATADNELLRRVSHWTDVVGLFSDFKGKEAYAITDRGRILSTAPAIHRAKHNKEIIYLAAHENEVLGLTRHGELAPIHDGRGLAHGLYVPAYASQSNEPQEGSVPAIVSLAVGGGHMIAVMSDGHVRCNGQNDFGQCRIERWGRLFSDFDAFIDERREKERRGHLAERQYQQALSRADRFARYLSCGERLTACVTADGHVLTTAPFPEVKEWEHVTAVNCGSAHVLGLHRDGRVSAAGNNVGGCCRVEHWKHVKEIMAGKYHSLGLTYDGRVLFAGWNVEWQGDVAAWTNVRLIRCTDTYTVALTYDGTILVAGKHPPFERQALLSDEWRDLLDIRVSAYHIAGLRRDGRVVLAGDASATSSRGEGISNVQNWRGVRAIAVGDGYTVGLCYGGHVVATGRNDVGQCDTSEWRHAVAVACGRAHTLALCADGTVLSTGIQRTTDTPGEESRIRIRRTVHELGCKTEGGTLCTTAEWRDVLAVACGREHAVALTVRGRLLACGEDRDGQCGSTSSFLLFCDSKQLDGYDLLTDMAVEPEPKTVVDISGVGAPSAASANRITISPWKTFGATLRADAERFADRLACDADHISVMDADDRILSYAFDHRTYVEEVSGGQVPIKLVAGGGKTVIMYATGNAKVRGDFCEASPLENLPNRIGENALYAVADVAFGEAHTAVLLRDGTVRSFGDGEFGQTDTASWNRIVALAAGRHYTVGLRDDGTVVATGARPRDMANRSRAVARIPRSNPCAVQGWQDVCRIVCAGGLTFGIRRDGGVYAAGSNTYGQCRTGAWEHVVSITSSGDHTVALCEDGRVYAVGRNESGECETLAWRHILMIAVMRGLTVGLCADGRLVTAGEYLGTGIRTPSQDHFSETSIDEILSTLTGIRSLYVHENRFLFLMADGTLMSFCPGLDRAPERLHGLHLFRPMQGYSALSRATGGEDSPAMARAVYSRFGRGLNHVVYMTDDGRVIAEGANDCGQCDTAKWENIAAVACGSHHTVALGRDGKLVATGKNPDGRCEMHVLNAELTLVNSESDNNTIRHPSQSESADHVWTAVACGYEHTVALRSDGRVYAVGNSTDGQCETRKWRDVDFIACGVRHTVGVCRDGTVVATGANTYGQCDLDEWRDVIMVACGEFHTVGLCRDGSLIAKGDDRRGQCRVGDLKNVRSIACLPEATLCIHTDGHVTLRGGTGEYDRAVASLYDILAIHAKEYRLTALTLDRRLIHIP